MNQVKIELDVRHPETKILRRKLAHVKRIQVLEPGFKKEKSSSMINPYSSIDSVNQMKFIKYVITDIMVE